MIRLLLATALFTLGVSEPSTRIRTGLRRDLPSHLRAATVNAIPPSAAATSVAQGTSFVYSYLNSHLDAKDTSYTENLALTVTNPNQQNAQVTITSPYEQFTAMTFVVGAGQAKTVSITPANMQTDYMDQYLQKVVIENKALFVNTNATVSLVASNSLSDGGGEDKFVVLPICQLGLEYHVVGDESSRVFQSYQSTNIITIVAAEDNTTVQMDYLFTTPTVLNRGQQLTLATYYSQTTIAVTSNKPVAVMSGSVCGFGYYNPSHCSYEVLMLPPSSSWAKETAFYKFQPENIGEFMVLFEDESTDLYLDEQKVDGNFTHDSFLIAGTYTGMYVRASGPIFVVAVGSANNEDQGAPFFSTVPSSASFSQGPYMFSVAPSLDEQLNLKHFIRVTCSTVNCIGTVKVDNYVPNGLLYTRMGKSNYYFVDVSVKGGQHSVSFVGPDTPWAPLTFGVTVYGFGLNRAYAFTPGLNYQSNGTC